MDSKSRDYLHILMHVRIFAVDLEDHPKKLCFEHFTSQVQLAGHNCRGIRILDYKCSICDRNFMSSANLASHMKWHDQQVYNIQYAVQYEIKKSGAIKDFEIKRIYI